MIGCDSCEEWYHGDCIGITEKESKNIKQFFCVRCTEEDPTLQTKWKTVKDPNVTSEERKIRKREKKERENQKEREGKKTSKRCGQCMGCYRTDDCGRCENCKDMKKYGGSNR